MTPKKPTDLKELTRGRNVIVCPICSGRGQLYDQKTDLLRECKGCNGTGLVKRK